VTTERLYYADAYRARFDARVVAREDDGRRVWLDRTAFYPTSGGQPHDLGTLAGVAVHDVIDEDDRIAHVLDAPIALQPGAEVSGEIDWPRRYDHMQQHTGQHLLSAVLEELFGHATVSVHFGRDSATLDLDTPALAPERLREAEARANAVVCENRPVTVAFEDAVTATGLRKATGRTGTIRIVTIADLDRSACGGTHVRATGEIGPILLRGVEKVRGASRVEFVCGLRAVRRARADYDALSSLARAQSCSVDEVPAVVAAQLERAREDAAALRRAGEELGAFRARAMFDRAAPDARGRRLVVERRERGALDDLKPLAQAVASIPGAVLVAASADPAVVLLATGEDTGIDAGATLRAAVTAAGGRGGGTPRLAQGSLPSREALETALESIRQAVG
jgi:alanyl-tRNA synthetase